MCKKSIWASVARGVAALGMRGLPRTSAILTVGGGGDSELVQSRAVSRKAPVLCTGVGGAPWLEVCPLSTLCIVCALGHTLQERRDGEWDFPRGLSIGLTALR